MKVKDFMIKDVITVNEHDTIKHLMTTLVNHKIGGVPVVNAEGTLVGMISDGDVLRLIRPKDIMVYDYFGLMTYSYEKESIEEAVSHLKNTSVMKAAKKHGLITVQEEDDMDTVLKLLSKHHFKKIPVINKENKVVGVISRGDVIRTIQKNIINSI